jgi:hypothetical protein
MILVVASGISWNVSGEIQGGDFPQINTLPRQTVTSEIGPLSRVGVYHVGFLGFDCTSAR